MKNSYMLMLKYVDMIYIIITFNSIISFEKYLFDKLFNKYSNEMSKLSSSIPRYISLIQT